MKKNKAKGAVIFIFCVVLISVIASYAIWAVTVDVFAFNDKKEAPVNVTIPEGAELSDVAKIYKEAGLIKFPVIYERLDVDGRVVFFPFLVKRREGPLIGLHELCMR